MSPIAKKIFPHLIAFFVFLAVAAIYFLPQIEGKEIRSSDILQYKGMSQEAREYYEKTGETTLWTNSMFGGMPTYQISAVSQGNNLKYLDKAARLNIRYPIGGFVTAMLGFYILLVVLGVNNWLALIGALAFGLTTNNLILFEAGHITKLKTISYFPLVMAGILLAYRRKQYLWGGLLFALGLGLNIFSNHVQMTYYLFLTLLIFGIAELIKDARRQQQLHFLRATGILILGGLLAVGSSANNLWVTYEYSKDTMRGEPILAQEAADPTDKPLSSSETEGLAWDYAMQWSNGTLDLFASFIPGVVGGGSQEKVRESSPLYDDPNWSRGVLRPSGGYAPLYWGSLPFTSGPIYFGAAVFLFFLIGLVLVEGPVKWWLGLGALLTFLLSLGENFEAFNEFFFYYVPLYNKFRTPNSVLSVTAFLVPLLGFLALGRILSGQAEKRKVLNSLYIGGGTAAAICLFFAFFGPSMFDFNAPGDARYQQAGLDLQPLIEARRHHMRMDALRALLLVVLSGALIWAYVNEKLKKNLFLAGLAVLVLFDLWTIGRRYVNPDSFVQDKQSRTQAIIPERPVDQQIFQQEPKGRGYYRVLDLTANPFTSTTASYYHNSLGGYHAAKLQRYQDLIDYYLQPGIQRLSQALNQQQGAPAALDNFLANSPVINMLNTKYLILSAEAGPVANPYTLGNAWFVKNIRQVDSPNVEIEALSTLDPDSVAVVHQAFSDYLSGLSPNGNGLIELTNYQPDHLTYQSNTSAEQLAVFSEIWYGPDKGWQAYVDGEPVKHIRANYILRALRVPAGQHTVEFRFTPQAFASGKMISQITSLLILLGLFGFGGYQGYHYLQRAREEEEEQKLAEAAKKKTVKRAKPRRKGKGK